MIICNLWLPSDHSFDDKEYELSIEAIVNDTFQLGMDDEKITECLDNHEFDEPIKHETLYELYFDRALIEAPFPAIDPAFAITSVRARKLNSDGQFSDQVRL